MIIEILILWKEHIFEKKNQFPLLFKNRCIPKNERIDREEHKKNPKLQNGSNTCCSQVLSYYIKVKRFMSYSVLLCFVLSFPIH